MRAREREHEIYFIIKDTGIGIPPESLRRLGQPFEQVESQMTKQHGGSGLGLAIARSLVEMHGGRLRIHSREGDGTIIVMRLQRTHAVAALAAE